jgi:hypothetical protein
MKERLNNLTRIPRPRGRESQDGGAPFSEELATVMTELTEQAMLLAML